MVERIRRVTSESSTIKIRKPMHARLRKTRFRRASTMTRRQRKMGFFRDPRGLVVRPTQSNHVVAGRGIGTIRYIVGIIALWSARYGLRNTVKNDSPLP